MVSFSILPSTQKNPERPNFYAAHGGGTVLYTYIYYTTIFYIYLKGVKRAK